MGNVTPSLSEFVRLNVDFVASSSIQTSDLLGLKGAWAKHFDLAAKILNTEGSISQSFSPCRTFASGYHPNFGYLIKNIVLVLVMLSGASVGFTNCGFTFPTLRT